MQRNRDEAGPQCGPKRAEQGTSDSEDWQFSPLNSNLTNLFPMATPITKKGQLSLALRVTRVLPIWHSHIQNN